MFFKKKKDYSDRVFTLTIINTALEVLKDRLNDDSARMDALEKRIAILEGAKPVVKRGRKPNKKVIKRGRKCTQEKK